MITDKVQIGKFLSYALRHEPEKVGVKMDKTPMCLPIGKKVNW